MVEEKKDNEVFVSGKEVEVIKVDKKTGKEVRKWEFETAEDRYLMAVRRVLDKFETAIIKCRGSKAIGRCVRIATNRQFDDVIDRSKTETVIGFQDIDKPDKKDEKKTFSTRVEEISITVYRK